MIVKCLVCKKEFKTYPSLIKLGRSKYCSRKCCGRALRRGLKKICLVCEKEFRLPPSQLKVRKGKLSRLILSK